jgi:hypothetical protein
LALFTKAGHIEQDTMLGYLYQPFWFDCFLGFLALFTKVDQIDQDNKLGYLYQPLLV